MRLMPLSCPLRLEVYTRCMQVNLDAYVGGVLRRQGAIRPVVPVYRSFPIKMSQCLTHRRRNNRCPSFAPARRCQAGADLRASDSPQPQMFPRGCVSASLLARPLGGKALHLRIEQFRKQSPFPSGGAKTVLKVGCAVIQQDQPVICQATVEWRIPLTRHEIELISENK